MKRSDRVVITGIGPLASTGIGKEAFWHGLLEGKSKPEIEENKLASDTWEKFHVYKMKGFDIDSFGLDKNILSDIKRWVENKPSTDLMFLLAAIKLALKDAGADNGNRTEKTGFILTHENPGYEEFFFEVFEKTFAQIKEDSAISKKEYYNSLYSDTQRAAYNLHSFLILHHASKLFNIHGYSLFINNACASGLYAMETACQTIRSGMNDMMVVAAADYPRAFKYLWFKQGGLYSSNGVIKPFSADSTGLVFGDGAVGIVMERLDHAIKRKANIYCEYLGGGFALEGWKITFPSVQSQFFRKTVEQAFARTGVKRNEIDLVCAHGVGSQGIDRYEAKLITDCFGEYPKKPLITAFKPFIGHTLGASALLETAILILCMKNKTILPTLNFDPIHPLMKLSPVKEVMSAKINTALKICSAFAGYDAAVILKNYSSS